MRKQAEADLVRLSQKYELVLRSAAEGILGLDLQGNHTFVNPAAAWMLGYEAADLIGRPSHNTWHHTKPDGSPYLVKECHIYASFRNGTVHHSSLEMFWRKDGTGFPVEYESRPIYEKGRVVGAVVTFADITERKLAEEKLRASEEQHRSVLQTAMDGFWLSDVQGRLLKVNDAYCRMSGYSEAELLDMRILDLESAEAEIDTAAHIQKVEAHGKDRFETKHRRKDGSVFDVEVSVQYRPEDGGQFVAFLRDITERKLAEQEVKQKSALISSLLDSIPDIIFFKDINGVYRGGNLPFAELVGLSRDEIAGTTDYDFFEKEIADAFRDQDRHMLDSGKARQNEEWVTYPDGRQILLDTLKTPHWDSDGTLIGLIGISRDITDKRRAEEALRESQERYRVLIENQGEGVGVVDTNEVFQFANPAAHRIFGVPTGELVGRNLREFVPPEDWQAIQNQSRERQEGLGSTYELNIVRPDGTRRCLLITGTPQMDANGVVSGTFGVFRDITEMKLAEGALRESEEKHRVVVERVNDGIVILQDGIVRFTNSGFAAMLGYETAETIGMNLTSFIPQENIGMILERYRQRMAGEKLSAVLETVLLQKNGNRISTEISGSVIQYKEEPADMVVIHDITERKRLEEERIELERRLLHSQKLESLGVLAGGIAHDFNNLLGAIIGNLSMVSDDVTELPDVREAVEQAMLAAERAADLTRQMLAYSGRGHFLVKELDLNKLVQENAQILRAVVSKTVTLDLQLSRELPEILADASQIQQVVMNLITNASEAIGDQAGTMTILTGVDSCNETYLSRSRTAQKPEAGMFVWVEVRDSGCGMSEDTQKRLFEPFFTTKFTGRGLGMAAVLGIVQGHGGAFIVDSEVGEGTKMRVLFPAVQIKADNISKDQQVTLATKSDVEQVRFSGTVLVVDDEEMIRGLCDAILSRFGFRVLQAVDGADAVRVFQAHASEISAVILDLTMPLMDGATAFEKMLQIKPDVKVILSSGYRGQDATRNFSGQHPAGFLHKPYQLMTLKAELERVLKLSAPTGAPIC
jgi:two-component system cell cycle sensor histidine kinase/response regulator CckA